MHLQYIYDTIVTSLGHVSACQCHLQGVRIKLKIIYSKMDLIYEIHNLPWTLQLIPVFVWIKYVNF